MSGHFKVLTILGSPKGATSNTRALVDDFVEEMSLAGLSVDHRVISLGKHPISPCRGCWNCTNEKPCPLSKRDGLDEIKAAMLDCDMLIMASPVYTNGVSAQMKALFDRLFTWCHIFPLLGKYSLSACTTGNDGYKETGFFLEKMLATYGTSSFGSIYSTGAFISGEFPKRAFARKKNAKLARRVARTVLEGRPAPITAMQKKMFKVMKTKMMGVHTINVLRYGDVPGQPKPPWLKTLVLKKVFTKMAVTDEQLAKWAGYVAFEYGWWKRRGWLYATSFEDLVKRPVPQDFDVRQRLLGTAKAPPKPVTVLAR